MTARIALLVAFFSAIGVCGFTLGRSSPNAGQARELVVPHEHPVFIALEMRTELKLSAEQLVRLEDIKAALAKELEPFHRRATALENRARELQQSGGGSQAKAQLEAEMNALHQFLKEQVPPILEKAAEEVAQTLDQKQRETLQRLAQARMAKSGAHDLVLTFIMENREQLGISPQQFTKLQFLQADLIRAFAPVREQMELLQIDVRKTVEQTQTEPPAELLHKMKSLEGQVAKLKEHISNRAIEEVLNPEQRQKLHRLLRESGKSNGGG